MATPPITVSVFPGCRSKPISSTRGRESRGTSPLGCQAFPEQRAPRLLALTCGVRMFVAHLPGEDNWHSFPHSVPMRRATPFRPDDCRIAQNRNKRPDLDAARTHQGAPMVDEDILPVTNLNRLEGLRILLDKNVVHFHLLTPVPEVRLPNSAVFSKNFSRLNLI